MGPPPGLSSSGQKISAASELGRSACAPRTSHSEILELPGGSGVARTLPRDRRTSCSRLAKEPVGGSAQQGVRIWDRARPVHGGLDVRGSVVCPPEGEGP